MIRRIFNLLVDGVKVNTQLLSRMEAENLMDDFICYGYKNIKIKRGD